MALSIKQLVDSKFRSIGESPEEIREVAEFIIANGQGLGTNVFIDQAKTALQKLDAIKAAEERGSADQLKTGGRFEGMTVREAFLKDAHDWIRGKKQGHAFPRALKKANDAIKEVQDNINNEASNIANILDIPDDATPETRAALEASAAEKQRELAGLKEQGDRFGLDTNKVDLVRTPSGFIPRSEATFQQKQSGRTGEAVEILPNEEGGFDIKGINSGDVIEGGFADVSAANARATQLQSGAAPNVQGREDLFAVEPGADQEVRDLNIDGTQVTPRTATADELEQRRLITLPTAQVEHGINAPPTAIIEAGSGGSDAPAIDPPRGPNGEILETPGGSSSSSSASAEVLIQTEQGVQQKEQDALAENPELVVTPEMRAQWVAESMDELRGNRFFAEVIQNAEFDLGVSLNRLVEDTRFRELSLAQQHKENLRGTQRSLQDRGLLFGGVRGQEEKELADKTNLGFQQLGSQFDRGLQDISQQGERQLGTDFTQAIAPGLGNTQQVGRVIAGSPVFQPGGETGVLQTQGGQFGSLPTSFETEARFRAGEKESAFREQFGTPTV